ncbi:hypothetical protein [Mycobacterium vicinigordonae]|uniref:Uncharacterized protein n=1 Tax=Mycobacterium vicinigordonae TaxID=1719132 RepID=A0A7D6DX80_9MYCO|nr:hypothetical protein [Mycobacterium vicinigordonae]QLL06129.1 hypothetical protein H0P51_20460 [Mycobacterium vicinigordonae]
MALVAAVILRPLRWVYLSSSGVLLAGAIGMVVIFSVGFAMAASRFTFADPAPV